MATPSRSEWPVPSSLWSAFRPGSSLEVNGVDTSVGYNLSVLVSPLRNPDGKPRLNLGLVYRSPVTLDLEGDFRINSARIGAKTRLELPSILTAAVAVWPVRDATREWKVEVDVDYVDWSSFRNLDVKLANGLTLPSPQKWSATYVVMLGTEYKWLALGSLPGWEVAARGGYIHSDDAGAYQDVRADHPRRRLQRLLRRARTPVPSSGPLPRCRVVRERGRRRGGPPRPSDWTSRIRWCCSTRGGSATTRIRASMDDGTPPRTSAR